MDNEVMPYRKKSQRKPPPKAKHRHDYQPCLIMSDGIEIDKAHGVIPKTKDQLHFGSYCTICGKIGSPDFDRWHITIHEGDCVRPGYTDEALKELNPETRTLPTFYVPDCFSQRFVDLKEASNPV